MLSTGMRAPMGIKVYGPDLETIEKAGKAIEKALKRGTLRYSLFRILRPCGRRPLSGDRAEP